MSRYSFRRILMTSLISLPALLAGNSEEIGFVEEYAMSAQREQTLRKLVPGTEPYFYYHVLYQQQAGSWDKSAETLESWKRTLGETGSWQVMKNRQVLGTYGDNKETALRFLTERLGLRFNHQKEQSTRPNQYPNTLPHDILDVERITERQLSSDRLSLASFSDEMLPALVKRNLTREQRINLLQRLKRPDVDGLLDLIVVDLSDPQGGVTFGARPVHNELTLTQLRDLAQRHPALMGYEGYVEAVVRRLSPTESEDPLEPSTQRQHLSRLREFSAQLGPAFSELKARILMNILLLDLAEGKADQELFVEYLNLPRYRPHLSEFAKRQAEGVRSNRYSGESCVPQPGLGEATLIREMLHRLADSRDKVGSYARYLTEDFVRACVAEGRILAGDEPSSWSDWLTPGAMEALKNSVSIHFSRENPLRFAPSETPSLKVLLKNVDRLLVRVYEINTLGYYKDTGQEIDTSINLDGLVSPSARTEKGTEGPYIQELRTFEFPEMKNRGVWIVEFIGSGIKSRVLVQKGRLRCVEGDSTAGQILRVVDEEGVLLKSARAHVGGKEYLPDDKGDILIPFAPVGKQEPLILFEGGFAALTTLERRQENFRLDLGVEVERESFLEGREGEILVRPNLWAGQRRHSLAALKSPELTINMGLIDGTTVTSVARDLVLSTAGELVHRIKVPLGLRTMEVTLSGKVERLLDDVPVNVSSSHMSTFNDIDATLSVEAPHLRLTREGAKILVTGKNGEPIAHRTLRLQVQVKGLAYTQDVHLQTDATGAVNLGGLPGVRSLVVGSDRFSGDHSFTLWESGATELPPSIHGVEGDVELPWAAGTIADESLALFSLRSNLHHENLTENLSLQDGILTLKNLAAGDYHLVSRRGQLIVRVEKGAQVGQAVVGQRRTLGLSQAHPLGLASVSPDGDDLVVRLTHASDDSRVHIIASTFATPSTVFSNLRSGFTAPSGVVEDLVGNEFSPNVPLGDEVRYILDRQSVTRYPGLMIPRPSLLLVPMELVDTQTFAQEGAGAGAYGGNRRGGRQSLERRSGGGGRGDDMGLVSAPNYNFLAQPALVLANLRPNESGEIRIPLKDFGQRTHVQVAACSREGTQYRSARLPATSIALRDRRLAVALEPGAKVVGVRELRTLKGGDNLEIADVTSSDFRMYDSLESVHSLFMSLSGNAMLGEFRFITQWNGLDATSKKDLYSKHACHELNFFIHEKDPEFFNGVVKPFLTCKKDRTFMDRWLLGEDLARYLEPFEFSRLNAVEKILLARKLGRNEITKLLRDTLDLMPPETETLDAFFEKGFASELAGDPGAPGQVSAFKKAKSHANQWMGREEMKAMRSLEEAAPAPNPANEAENGDSASMADFDNVSSMDTKDDNEAYESSRARAAVYLALKPTKAWIENNYHHLRPDQQGADLVGVDDFWLDYAASPAGIPFLSSHLDKAAGNFTEMMLALSVLGLPEKAEKHEEAGEGRRYTLKAGSPLVALVEENRPADGDSKGPQVLVGQNIYPAMERYRRENGEQVDNFVQGDLQAGKVYGCEVVITNPSSRRLTLGVLAQIPRGSLPVSGCRPTLRRTLVLEAHATVAVDLHFYFPEAGSFAQGGAQVSCRSEYSASTNGMELKVRSEAAEADKNSWDYVSQEGSTGDVVDFINDHNLMEINLDRIAFRLGDQGDYEDIIEALEKRMVYTAPLWAYAFKHDDRKRMKTYLENSTMASAVGPLFECELLSVDPLERRFRVHTEFDPLVNARTYRFGAVRKITNAAIMTQYRSFLEALAHRQVPTAADSMTLVYFLFLQDRIEEALAFFAKIPRSDGMGLQHDYMSVCASIYGGEFGKAREIAEGYKDYPVELWRTRFVEALRHLDEASGQIVEGSGNEALGNSQPLLALTSEEGKLVLTSKSLEKCRLSFHEVDLEQMFSINPFVRAASGCFSHVAARHVVETELTDGRREVEVPEALRNRPLMVEAVSGGLSSSAMFSRHDLNVQVMDRAGHLRVQTLADGKLVPAAYVKVYARLKDGRVVFHKDGNTDIRGRFDYASVSTESQGEIERFAILVEAGAKGAIVLEAAPPAR
ncbi:MAG: hypothetical protein AB7F75_00385 [Planctomycetota bacterium]